MSIIMVTGLPGTGKSTFAAALAEAINAAHLNTDVIRNALGKRGQYDDDSKIAVYHALLGQAATCLTNGQTVVIDGTFFQQSFRESFRRLAADARTSISWIEICADEALVRTRVSQQRAYTEANFDVYLSIKAQYEPLTIAHLKLRSDRLHIDDMVVRAKAYLNTYV
ncbi:MAG TPA: ATP-binding protein [Saprospiraceae bacterium]|nr:ATP-binding protein [Saprospiraceae bacterium]HMP13191.1 ATP-binding protein [Saprospiraceae bacterium]